MIAQDVKKVFPELVSRDTVSRMLNVNYSGFIPILLEAIKVQQEEIDEIKTRLNALEDE